jgi:hypothetical protein
MKVGDWAVVVRNTWFRPGAIVCCRGERRFYGRVADQHGLPPSHQDMELTDGGIPSVVPPTIIK